MTHIVNRNASRNVRLTILSSELTKRGFMITGAMAIIIGTVVSAVITTISTADSSSAAAWSQVIVGVVVGVGAVAGFFRILVKKLDSNTRDIIEDVMEDKVVPRFNEISNRLSGHEQRIARLEGVKEGRQALTDEITHRDRYDSRGTSGDSEVSGH